MNLELVNIIATYQKASHEVDMLLYFLVPHLQASDVPSYSLEIATESRETSSGWRVGNTIGWRERVTRE